MSHTFEEQKNDSSTQPVSSHRGLKKNKSRLLYTTIISITLNVALLVALIYTALIDLEDPTTILTFPKMTTQEQILVSQYKNLSLEELLIAFNKEPIRKNPQNRICRKDLILGALVSFHHFNLEKALGGIPLHKQTITLSSGEPFFLFPGLTEPQLHAVCRYGNIEKWPLTDAGLFYALKKAKAPYDPSLLETFYLSQEYCLVYMLFSKTGLPLKKEMIASLLVQGNWSEIQMLGQQLKNSLDFSLDRRRALLIHLLKEGQSKLAAKILAETDMEASLLQEEVAIDICRVLKDKTPSNFLKKALESSLFPTLNHVAASCLYEKSGESPPNTIDLVCAKERFIDLKKPQKKEISSQKEPLDHRYIVAPGDSLWKIAKRYQVSIDTLKQRNHLTSNQLKAGQELFIPKGSSNK